MKCIFINKYYKDKFAESASKLFSRLRIYRFKKENGGFEIEDNQVKDGTSDVWWWLDEKEFEDNFKIIK